MSRLTWDGRQCSNPPEGWRIMIVPSRGIFYYQATQTLRTGKHGAEVGAMHNSAGEPTEAEAKRSCEAALLRLGVLEPGEEDEVAAMQKFSKFADDRSIKAIVRALAALEVEKANG